MGVFKDLSQDIYEMYHDEGMKETEIATSLGISVTLVHEVLASYSAVEDSELEEVSYNETDPDDDYNAEHY